jgi:hypothetical protein
MADNPEVIREQMEETRWQLSDKIEALEQQVTDTVRATTETVSETVEAVKQTVEHVTDAVQETFHSVGEVFDLRLQTERHPWLVFGGSVTLGYLAAQLLDKSGEMGSALEGEQAAWSPTYEAPGSTVNGYQPEQLSRSQPKVGATQGGFSNWLGDHLGRFKGLAIGSFMGVLRDLAKEALPESIADRMTEEIDNLTRDLGGEPIRGPILSHLCGEGSDACQGRQEEHNCTEAEQRSQHGQLVGQA